MKLFLRSILFSAIAIIASAPFASGQQYLYWQGGILLSTQGQVIRGPGDQDFNTSTNWGTVPQNTFLTGGISATVPGAGTIAVIQADLNNGSAFYTLPGLAFVPLLPLQTVTINQTTQGNTVQGLLVSNFGFAGLGAGTVNFKNTPGHTLAVDNGGIYSPTGDFVVDAGVTLNYSNGPFVVSKGLIVIGDPENTFSTPSSPPYTIGGPGTFNIVSGSFTYDAANQVTQMVVGDNAIGTTGFTTATGTVTQGAAASTTSDPNTGIVTNTPTTFSAVTLGSSLILGYDGGAGTWNVTNGSSLATGTQSSSYLIALGSNGAPLGGTGTNSQGTLTVGSGGIFNVGYFGSTMAVDLQVGTVSSGAPNSTAGGSGSIIESGTTSVVNISGTNTTVEIGALGGGTGSYVLNGGTLNIGMNSTDAVTFLLGGDTGSVGALTQTGGTLNVGPGAIFDVGTVGVGTYTFSGGVANFKTLLTIGSNGTVNLNGGTLTIDAANLVGTGSFTFGGGNLDLTTTGTAVPYIFPFSNASTLAANSITTIDTTQGTGTFGAFDFAPSLSGSGGINFVGTEGVTTFNMTGIYSYTGPTIITSGTLDATVDQVTNSSSLGIDAHGVLNLSTTAGGSTTVGSIVGLAGAALNISFDPANTTLELTGLASSFAGTTTLGANGTAGTLQVSNGTFADITTGVGAEASGLIIGGDPAVADSGVVTVGATTFTGSTMVNTGFTLNAGNLNGDVTNDGTLNVINNIGLTTANTVDNTGIITAGTIAGAVASNSGTITTASIGSDVTSNSGTINVTGAAGIGGNVSNAGVVTTTSVVGSVTNGGLFTASSSVATVGGDLNNTGIVMSTAPLPTVLNAPTFTVGGDLTSSGILVIRTNGTTADSYQVAGAADLDNTVLQIKIVNGGKIGTTTYDVVTATTVSDTNLTISPDTALFQFAANNTGTTEQLMVTQLPIATYAETPNQLAVAQALDGSNSPLFGYFGQVSLADATAFFPGALESLTPESLQYARNIAFENSNMMAVRMNNVDADLRAGYAGLDTNAISVVTPGFESGMGRSLGSLLASNDPGFHSAAPNGVNYYPGGESGPASSSAVAPTESPTWDSSSQVMSDTPNPYMATQYPSGPEAPNMNEFIGGDVVLADLNQDHTGVNSPSSKASYTAGDAVAGVSFRMNSHLAAGVLFDYNHTDAKTDGAGSKTTVDSYSPGLFATYFDHGFYVNGLFSFGYNNYSNRRNIAFLGDTASSSPSGQQYVADLDTGYDFHPNKNWVVGPTLGVTYTHLDIDSFTETGAPGADLSVDSQSVDSLRSRLGGHAMFQTFTGDVLLQPNLSVMWQHEYMADSSGITSTFSDYASNSFTIETASPSRDSALISLGLTATLSNSMALYLNYLADVGANDYWAQSVIGGFKARF